MTYSFHIISLLALSALTVVACSSDNNTGTASSSSSSGSTSSSSSSSSSSGSSGSTTTRTSWGIGTWFAPAYDNGEGKSIPAKGLGLTADGKFTHNTSGVQDDQGTWTMSGTDVVLPHGKLDPAKNCTFMNYNDGNRIDTYYRDDFPTDCPNQPPALTAVEKCLVGDFEQTTNQNLATTNFKWKRTSYRTEIFDQIYVGNGDAAITEVYYWTVTDGKFCTQTIGPEAPGCTPIDWDMIDSTRKSAKDPGCVEP